MIIVAFILLFFVSPAFSATYYVDYTSGADTNNGTATGTAFEHSPGDPAATDTAASTTLSGGDTVIFRGGVEYVIEQCEITLSWSGTSNESRIIYDGNSALTWGTGKAILTTNNDTYVCNPWRGFHASVTRNNITIKNIEFTDIGGYVTPPSASSCSPVAPEKPGRAIWFAGDANNITLQDNYVHEIGHWGVSDPINAASIGGGGFQFYLGDHDNILIDSNEFKRVRTAIGIYTSNGSSSTNITISNNNIHNYIVWGLDFAANGPSTITNVDIVGNSIYDYTEYDQTNWEANSGCGTFPHTDGIFLRGENAPSTWTNVDINNNLFYDTGGVSSGGTASIYITENPSVDIYNNTFWNVQHDPNISIGNTYSTGDWGIFDNTIRVMNNSFYGAKTFIGAGGDESGDAGVTFSFINNSFHSTATSGSQVSNVRLSSTTSSEWDSVIDDLDYNLYYNPNGASPMKWGPGLKTLAEVKSCTTVTGCEDWETNDGGETDPEYSNTTTRDFSINSDSPLVDVGDILSTHFTDDFIGTTRSAPWDIGAYEYIFSNKSGFSGSFTIH